VEKWAANALPGETVISYALTSTYTPSGPGILVGGWILAYARSPELGDNRRSDLITHLGLDREKRLQVQSESTLLVLTDRQLVLATRSALNRPKDILHAGPAGRIRVHWFDHDAGSGNRFRHFITEFGDGHWRSDRAGLTALGRDLKASNSDDFVSALGDKAIEVTQGQV
jgi:hypothetical protein